MVNKELLTPWFILVNVKLQKIFRGNVMNSTISKYSRVYDQYSFQAIPVMGQLIAGQWKAYQYLVESIRQFPNQVCGDQYACLFSDPIFSHHARFKLLQPQLTQNNSASNLIVSYIKFNGIILESKYKAQ
jgi:hypothetical protein